MKVLHTEWSDGWGGQEIRIITEMEGVREKGVEVMLACREGSRIKEEALKRNFKVYCLPFKGNFDVGTLFKLKKIIKKEKIDIVNTHSGKDTWVGGVAAKISGSKFIRTRHLSNKINSSRLNFINELADFIITTGESIRKDMIKYNRIDPMKIMSIPTGVDDMIYNPDLYEKQECRRKFRISNDVIAIGMLAVLRSFKRHDRFIRIANELKKIFPDKKFKFLIAGEGAKRKEIENMIKQYNLEDDVIMYGHINNGYEFLKSLDMFVLSSDDKEGVPQSLIQALMMNVASFATDVGSVKDLFNGNNFILTKNDENDLLDKMIKYIKGEITIVKNRKWIVENFSKKVMIDKILEIYKKINN